MPGAAKAKLERLTSVVDVNINLYGVPKLYMNMVRNSDMGRTPDVRTRPIFPQWACVVSISYVRQLIQQKAIANLFGAAGVIVGIGDWRPQKAGSFGTFRIVPETDSEFRDIVKKQGRVAQQAAYDHPVCYDQDSEELLAWYESELVQREVSAPSSSNGKRRPPKGRVVTETVRGELVAN